MSICTGGGDLLFDYWNEYGQPEPSIFSDMAKEHGGLILAINAS